MSTVKNVYHINPSAMDSLSDRMGKGAYEKIAKSATLQAATSAHDAASVEIERMPMVIRTEDGKLHVYNQKMQEYFPKIK